MEFKGFTYGYDGKHGQYRTAEGIKSQKLLFETGVNWICLAFAVVQDTAVSTEIKFNFGESITDRDILAAVKHAHDNGIKVCLKPMVNCADGTWRAKINFPDLCDFDNSEDLKNCDDLKDFGNFKDCDDLKNFDVLEKDIYWIKWFNAYEKYMLYYAELAEEAGCEMLCVGCEMLGTERKESLWRALLKKIRSVYSGKLIYNTNHGHEKDVNWIDMLDYIGTSAYFPVGGDDQSYETMVENWEKIADELEEVHKIWNKPIVFVEIGCRSAKTCSTMPWDYQHKDLPRDEGEQARFYDSCLSVMTKRPWFDGVFWWDWSTYIYDDLQSAKQNDWFNVHLKEAETIIKKWYKKL